MPRTRRQWVPNVGAHVISRFVDRRFYLIDDADRRTLLDAMGHAHQRWDWRWLSWAAMSSHVHYGLVAGVVDPDRFFHCAHSRFAQRYHRQQGGETLGPVFAERPKLYAVAPCALAKLVAYHHRNPTRAGVVDRASRSTWTSHRVYLRIDPSPAWFDVEFAMDCLGFADTPSGRREFDDFVMSSELDDRPEQTSPGVSMQACVRTAPHTVDWERVISAGRVVTELPRERSIDSRTRRAVETRLVIATVATTDLGQSYAATAQALGVSTGGLFNLLARERGRARVNDLVRALRERLGVI